MEIAIFLGMDNNTHPIIVLTWTQREEKKEVDQKKPVGEQW